MSQDNQESSTFQDEAIKRLGRSGVSIDPSKSSFVYDRRFDDVHNHQISIDALNLLGLELDTHCYGSEKCFILIDNVDLMDWCVKNSRSKVPISKLGKVYIQLPHDLTGSIFTAIPDNSYTAYECDQWLAEHSLK